MAQVLKVINAIGNNSVSFQCVQYPTLVFDRIWAITRNVSCRRNQKGPCRCRGRAFMSFHVDSLPHSRPKTFAFQVIVFAHICAKSAMARP